MSVTLRIALRDWDYVTPLVVGDVSSPRLNIAVDRVSALVGNLAEDEAHDAAEISFSRYSQFRHEGDDRVVGMPNFIMRGFRHRCVITTKQSPIRALADLTGKKIGLTGWRDSGNTWTRAALRREGVGIEDATWFAGRLTEAHPITDRLDGFGRPGRIEAAPDERPMVDLLLEGGLDAVLTPFMPKGFFDQNSSFRRVLEDSRTAEVAYFQEVGYVPGMHLIGIKAAFVRENPWVIDELGELIDESHRLWLEKREKYADTTPWIIDELARCAADLPPSWNASGFQQNEKMMTDFAFELYEQKILPRILTPTELFPMHATGRRPLAH
ncbi:4,5-dihydroxyphthalate decarboxylase [Sinorhizobium terangae]|uniref:Nitrate ABC transporter substrate-binding protein n=1 Tax=Sinorhizobium terangae TaxID=110322 RepID=A0A6N7LMD3_SINTE|nr:nitrate ABC transporter substrate-binding protein [Sinorhizobium terangae]MBB4188771.1 4,5-dihydroxyphthalate decarboxylase [Sinorhizobium terangae]MQX18917.1 nitrate ABC transporter substrate-binding protein [Sinorhizobium terangae]